MKTSHPITAIIAIMILAIIGSCSSNDIPVEPEGPPAPHLSREDSLVLVTLYKEGGGEFWDNKWDLNDKVENWKGISCYLVDTPKKRISGQCTSPCMQYECSTRNTSQRNRETDLFGNTYDGRKRIRRTSPGFTFQIEKLDKNQYRRNIY